MLANDRPGTAPPRASWRRAVALIAAVALAGAAVVGLIYRAERVRLERAMLRTTYNAGPAPERVYYYGPGRDRPPTRPAATAGLADAEPVLGVIVGGRARAYRLAALADESTHILNDMVGGVPTTVTYCDIADCAAAFVGPPGAGPLPISLGGLQQNRLVLVHGGSEYYQDNGRRLAPGPGPAALPFATLPATRTTWGAWRAAHPETDVHVGDGPAAPPGPEKRRPDAPSP
jgi:hypothetical protein